MNDGDQSLLNISRDLTHYEVIRALMHDLLHRVGDHRASLNALQSKQRILFGGDPTYRHLQVIMEEAQSTFGALQDSVEKMRAAPFRQNLEPEPFDLREVMMRAIATMHLALQQANVNVVTELDDVQSHGRPALLENVVMNLIINSIQAQKSRPRMRRNAIHMRLKRIANDWVFTFWDEGPGINQAVWQPPSRIFDAGTSSGRANTGYGLYLSRRI